MKLPFERTPEWKRLRLLGKISLGSSLIGLAMLVILVLTFLMTDKILATRRTSPESNRPLSVPASFSSWSLILPPSLRV